MGITICQEHGRQQIGFASPRLQRQAELGEAGDDAPLLIGLKWCDFWWPCPVDFDFFTENGMHAPASGVLIIDDEDRSEELLQKMVPACTKCLLKLLTRRASKDILNEFINLDSRSASLTG